MQNILLVGFGGFLGSIARYNLGGAPHLQQIERFRTPPAMSTRQISSGTGALSLPVREADFSDLRYSIGDQEYFIDDFMLHNHVGGLLVLQNGENLLERYGLGNTEDTVWIGYSVAKTVTSLLFGAAIADGFRCAVERRLCRPGLGRGQLSWW